MECAGRAGWVRLFLVFLDGMCLEGRTFFVFFFVFFWFS